MPDATHDPTAGAPLPANSGAAPRERPGALERLVTVFVGIVLTSVVCAFLFALALDDPPSFVADRAPSDGEGPMANLRDAMRFAIASPAPAMASGVAWLATLPFLLGSNTRRSVPLVAAGTGAAMLFVSLLGAPWVAACGALASGVALSFVARRRFPLRRTSPEPWGDLP